MKVSVIIPVYNAEKTLARSLESVKVQTHPDIEVVVVDDCSRDSSLQLVEAFTSSFETDFRRVVVCRHEVNQGVAAARNTGLDNATGDFVCFVDADDWMEPDAIAKAVSADADIVGWDWKLATSSSERYMRQADYSVPEQALKNLMSGTMRWNLWLFLSRRSLWEDVRFIPGMNMGEDMMAMIRLMMKATHVAQLHEALYHYIQTDQSVSRSMSEENMRQVTANVEAACAALRQSSYAYMEYPYMDYLRLNIKLPLLISDSRDDYRKWAGWFAESDKAAMENKALPLRTRLLQYMASKHFWAGVKLYYTVIYKCVYRILYK